MVIENDQVNMCWHFEKETTAQRPDITIEYNDHMLIQIIDMTSPVIKYQ